MRYLFLALLIASGSTLFAQTNKFDFDISSGVSLPLGKYGSHDLNEGSFTSLGGNILLKLNWLAMEPFGISASVQGIMNPVDVASLGWARVAADPFMSDVSIRSDPYIAISALGGIFYKTDIKEKFKLQTGINAGMTQVHSPYQLHKPKYFLFGPEYFEITTASDYAFTYQLSLDFEYEFREDWSLILHSSFNHAVAEFTYWTANEIRIDRKPISYVLANFGIRLKI